MFKQKSRTKANRPYTLPAPVKGLDAVSPVMGMSENSALVLENWFPAPSGLQVRDGYISHATGFASQVDRLHVYSAVSGGEKLFATNSSGVYDATLAGAIGAAAIALTDGKCISAGINTGAGNYFFLVNGVDTMKQYDGTTWSSVAVLGAVATTKYNYVELYRQRLFFVEKNSLNIEYLAPNAISGAPTAYTFSATFKRGGYIVALGTWTLDSGTGGDDRLVVLTSNGEAAVFVGNDPATWAPAGVYQLPRPLGKTPLSSSGGDLLILTEEGIYPMSSAVQSTAISRTNAVSERIKPAFSEAAGVYAANQGWQIISDPIKPMLLVNIPATPVRKQFVMHAQTGAWSVYSGWDALCFARMGKEIYFGTSNGIKRVFGVSDEGVNITATLLQAYSRFGMQQNKHIELTKPYLSNNGGFTYAMGFAENFADARELTLKRPSGNISAAIWGVSLFGTAVWTGGVGVAQDWDTVPNDHTLWKAFYLQVVTNNASIEYFGADNLLVPSGSL